VAGSLGASQFGGVAVRWRGQARRWSPSRRRGPRALVSISVSQRGATANNQPSRKVKRDRPRSPCRPASSAARPVVIAEVLEGTTGGPIPAAIVGVSASAASSTSTGKMHAATLELLAHDPPHVGGVSSDALRELERREPRPVGKGSTLGPLPLPVRSSPLPVLLLEGRLELRVGLPTGTVAPSPLAFVLEEVFAAELDPATGRLRTGHGSGV
jgi:hypothetical protein